jgi:hypothetical protein
MTNVVLSIPLQYLSDYLEEDNAKISLENKAKGHFLLTEFNKTNSIQIFHLKNQHNIFEFINN